MPPSTTQQRLSSEQPPALLGVVSCDFQHRPQWLWISVIVASIATFWATCIAFLSPLPVGDDYDGVLLFLEKLIRQPNWHAKAGIILFFQHNEYKPIYGNMLEAVQFWLAGHVSFPMLSLLGDVQVCILAWVLWRVFTAADITRNCRLTLFVPIALLIFQTNYAETLNWPMPGLQNLGVVMFALCAISLAPRDSNREFALSCLFLVCTIASSANGFALLVPGVLLFGQQKRWSRAGIWIILTAASGVVYAHGYVVRHIPEAAQTGHASLLKVAPFVFSFLGAACGAMVRGGRYLSIPIGLGIALVFFIAWRSGFSRRNPAIFYYMMFLGLTALGVAAVRGSFGYDQSLSGRYKIYSDLLLVGCYCFLIDQLPRFSIEQRRKYYRAALAASLLVYLIGNALGLREMKKRKVALATGMKLYRDTHHAQGPLYMPENPLTGQLNQRFGPILDEAQADGIYTLPAQYR